MSTRLETYLALERAMLALDQADDSMADRLRDMMDPIWYSLSDDEHALLDGRGLVTLARLHPIRCPIGPSLHWRPTQTSGQGITVRNRRFGLTASLSEGNTA